MSHMTALCLSSYVCGNNKLFLFHRDVKKNKFGLTKTECQGKKSPSMSTLMISFFDPLDYLPIFSLLSFLENSWYWIFVHS